MGFTIHNDGLRNTITNQVIKYSVTSRVWIAIANDLFIYENTNDVIKYVITNFVII